MGILLRYPMGVHGDEFGVTRERIRQIEAKKLGKLYTQGSGEILED